jgi:hypothetical protein
MELCKKKKKGVPEFLRILSEENWNLPSRLGKKYSF